MHLQCQWYWYSVQTHKRLNPEAYAAGAGFYVDATEPVWAKNYRMYSYVTAELPALLRANAAQEQGTLDPARASVMGHSMGGHGALVVGLRNPSTYASISAFSAICHPCACPWGKKGALPLMRGAGR